MRIDRAGVIGFGLMAVGAAATGQVPAATVQQDFVAATALADNGDHAGALAAWEKLEPRTKPGSRNRGVVLVSKSTALFKLQRPDEAVVAARDGLALLPASDPTLAEFRWRAYFSLGNVAEQSVDYASASAAYAAAEKAIDDPSMRLGAMLAYIETATFVDPQGAEAALVRLDAMVAKLKVDSAIAAMVARRHALVLLNRGEFKPAQTYAMAAVKALGGLTSKTDSQDVSARSDVAIASLLAGNVDEAREYMAMTGAGRLTKGTFDPAAQMYAPDCGGEAGLKPADMAVVEFSIDDDGHVMRAVPVYAAGGGAVAIEFARAAREWSWTPEQVKELPKFFRYNARIEMRCSMNFERPSIAKTLQEDLSEWLGSKGIALAGDSRGSDAFAVGAERAALADADRKFGPTALATLPAVYRLASNVVVGKDEANGLYRRALAIADANTVPATARLLLVLRVQSSAAVGSRRGAEWQALETLLTDPGFAADPQARSAIRLLMTDGEGRRKSARSRVLLQQVVDDAALKPNDPMRVGALIRLASIEREAGNLAEARAAFDKSGLAANQCAILDTPPHFVSAGGTFPQEAMAWGFEGWTRTQFDVDANGKVVNQRAVLSYPPFVFTKAGVETMAGARYSKTFRPDGGVGCGGLGQNVKFLMH